MSRFPALKTLPRRVGVIVASHNRAHFLPIALQSIANQTHKPERVLVIDDGSTDGTREIVRHWPGVEYHYVDLGQGLQSCHAKRFGFDLLTDELPYVCCIDSDDWIDADYLERLLDVMESDCRVGVAYPKIQQFGERTDCIDIDYDPDILSRTNIAPSTSLMRSDALIQIGGWPIVAWHEHEDWAAWRRMRALGWQLKKGDTTYHWRRHADSQTFKYRGGSGCCGYPAVKPDHNFCWAQTVDKEDLVTIAVPFCGRHRTLAGFLDFLERQTFPHGLCRLLFFDNSCDPSFSRKLREWLTSCDYGAYTYFPCHIRAVPNQANDATADAPVCGNGRPNAMAINHRCAGNWNRIAQLVQTDLIWCLEDDIIPPLNCLDRLLRAIRPDVDAVGAPYAGRGCRWVARDWVSLSPLRAKEKHLVGGVEPCGHVGLGCVLVRRQTLQSVPMRSNGSDPDGHRWFDWNLWADVARQGRCVKIDGDLVCEHLMGGD